MRHAGTLVLACVAALSAQGCAAVGLSLFTVGAGVTAGAGTAYTMDGIAYRTFADSVERVRTATLASLKRMDIEVKSDDTVEKGRKLVAIAGDRTVDIELEALTGRTTRIRVTAKHGLLFRDRSTAGEIIAQVGRSLDEMPAAVAEKPKAAVTQKSK